MHVRLGVGNNMHPLSWGAQTEKIRKFIYIKKEFEFLLKLSFVNHCIKTFLQRQVDSAISSAVKDFYWLMSTLYLNWSFDLLASLVEYEGRV